MCNIQRGMVSTLLLFSCFCPHPYQCIAALVKCNDDSEPPLDEDNRIGRSVSPQNLAMASYLKKYRSDSSEDMVNHCSTTIKIDGYSSNDLLLPAVNFQISVRWARVWVAWDRVRNECVIIGGTITMQYESFFFCILAGLIIWYYCTYTFEQEELRNPLFSLAVLASGRFNGENSMHEAYWHWKLKKQTLIAKITMYVNDIDGTRCLKAKAAS